MRSLFKDEPAIDATWTRGLKTRTAHALLAAGFRSRDDVANAPLRRLQRVPNLGTASIGDIDRWLGRRSSEANLLAPDAIQKSADDVSPFLTNHR